MRKITLVIALSMLLTGGTGLLIWRAGEKGAETSQPTLSFADVDKTVQSGLDEGQLAAYLRRIEGTRVKWAGTITGVDQDNTVYLTMSAGEGRPNVQFELPAEAARTVRKDQTVSFTGTIRSVSIVQTFPPMPNTYVTLDDAMLITKP